MRIKPIQQKKPEFSSPVGNLSGSVEQNVWKMSLKTDKYSSQLSLLKYILSSDSGIILSDTNNSTVHTNPNSYVDMSTLLLTTEQGGLGKIF